MYALILAGGKGERLRPLTDTLPKPMAPVAGKPILERQLAWLKDGGVEGAVFLAGYRWEAIRSYFGDGSRHGMRVSYSVESSPLGRGGAIKQGYPLAPHDDEPVVVTNGDIITRQPLQEIIDFHRESPARRHGPAVTLLAVPMVSPYGLVDMDDAGGVVGFREKVELPHWINGGVYVFDREVFSEFPDLGDHEVETFPRLAEEGRIAAFRTRSFWTSIDSFKDLREAEDFLNREGAAGDTEAAVSGAGQS
jgi:NDP-sugar pyrophosphorylase family protein